MDKDIAKIYSYIESSVLDSTASTSDTNKSKKINSH